MAATVGKDGKIAIGAATIAYMDTWSLNPGIGTAEITAYGNTSKAFGSTLREWTVNFSGTLDRSDTDQADLMDQFEDGTLADIAIRCYTVQNSTVGGTTEYWSGNVRLTSQTVNSAVADKVSISWTGQGNGNLAYTTVST